MAQQTITPPENAVRIPNPGGGDTGNQESWYSALTKTQANFVELYTGVGANAYNTDSTNTDFTVTAAKITGGSQFVMLNLTGALSAGKAITLPTVADLVAAMPNAKVGSSYRLRILNSSSGNYAWTVTTNTGWGTLSSGGTMTIAQNTTREFIVTLTSLTAATLQSLGQVATTAL